MELRETTAVKKIKSQIKFTEAKFNYKNLQIEQAKLQGKDTAELEHDSIDLYHSLTELQTRLARLTGR